MSKTHFLVLLFVSTILSAGACDDSEASDAPGNSDTDDTTVVSTEEAQTNSDSQTFAQDTNPSTEISTDKPRATSGDTDPESSQSDTGVLETDDGTQTTDHQSQTDKATDSSTDPGQITIVDVRTPTEYAQDHLDCAVNIPLSELEGRLNELPDKDAIIIVYCRSGNRSAQAKKILDDNGYTGVIDGKGLATLRKDIADGAYDELNLPCVS